MLHCSIGLDRLPSVKMVCAVCKLELKAKDSGDGPMVFVIFIIGPLTARLAFWPEMSIALTYPVHLVLWLPLVFARSVRLLQPFKATFLDLQFHNKTARSNLSALDPQD